MRRRLAMLVATAAWIGCSVYVTAQSETNSAARTTSDGVYNREQAQKGSALFHDVCLACHADPYWKASWPGKRVSDLYTTIRKYMPDDNPGTLTDAEAAAALAYIFASNGMPAGGDPLPADSRALADIAVGDRPAEH